MSVHLGVLSLQVVNVSWTNCKQQACVRHGLVQGVYLVDSGQTPYFPLVKLDGTMSCLCFIFGLDYLNYIEYLSVN